MAFRPLLPGILSSGAATGLITGYDFDPGVRDNAAPAGYSTTMTIGANAACLFLVTRAQAVNSGTPTLTVDGNEATLITGRFIDDAQEGIFNVFYIAGVTPGASVSVVTGNTNAVSTAITALMLSETVSLVADDITAVQTTVSDGGATGVQPIATVSTAARDFVYFVQPVENRINPATSYVDPDEIFPPFAQARSGVTPTNYVHLCSGVSEAPRDVTGYIDITNTFFGTQTAGKYFKISM